MSQFTSAFKWIPLCRGKRGRGRREGGREGGRGKEEKGDEEKGGREWMGGRKEREREQSVCTYM